VFGGECATAEKYHHYRDLWRLDIKSHKWEEVRARGGTPPGELYGYCSVSMIASSPSDCNVCNKH
jgi:hypothetical protein